VAPIYHAPPPDPKA
jgi:hypothetical protein